MVDIQNKAQNRSRKCKGHLALNSWGHSTWTFPTFRRTSPPSFFYYFWLATRAIFSGHRCFLGYSSDFSLLTFASFVVSVWSMEL